MFSGTQKKKYMALAFAEAGKAKQQAEIPIGCVIVDSKGQVIAQAYNRRELDQDSTEHAEILAIKRACRKTGSWRLNGCSIFITLEPCAMCAGAIINARISNVFFAALDPKAGAAGSVVDLFAVPKFNHHPKVVRGIYREEASQMLKKFFKEIRAEQKHRKVQDSGK